MEAKILLAFILFVVPAAFADDTDNEYCKLETCPNGSHTLCQYEDLELSEKCLNPMPNTEINEENKQYIVKTHLFYRIPRILHSENLMELPEIDLDTPIAALVWDEELAIIAQRWANQCEHGHDACRNVARFNVTQRYATYESSVRQAQHTKHVAFVSIERWYEEELEERQRLPKLSLDNPRYTSACYYRIAWGNANRIGCGIVKTKQPPFATSYFVCNYGHSNQ